MRGWMGFERRWAEVLFGALMPGSEAGLPGFGSLSLEVFWERFGRVAPPLLRVGLRAAVWLLTWSPVLWCRTWRHFPRLSAVQQADFLAGMEQSRLYLARQLVMTLKTVASFAYFQDEGVRAVVAAVGEQKESQR